MQLRKSEIRLLHQAAFSPQWTFVKGQAGLRRRMIRRRLLVPGNDSYHMELTDLGVAEAVRRFWR